MSWIFKRFFDRFKLGGSCGNLAYKDDSDYEFRAKVSSIEEGKRDYSCLYDANALLQMTENERREYMKRITQRYIKEVKNTEIS
ncbi:MAG: hypothetical protein HFI85_05875 [Clostridia bacterium]|nr:hypothetical protein [Clostridia bacterium]